MLKNADNRVIRLISAALAAGTVLVASQAYGQRGDNRSAEIEEVIVTAQKIEESLQDTPVSVSAFGAEELAQIGVSEAKDVANFTPGLTMRKQSASSDNYAIGIRSVSSGETALAIDPTVGIYQDGVYIARSTGAAFDIVDLERIEVLRGPQGTLFGRNTIGGAINIITAKPKGEFAFRQALTYAARDKRVYHTTVDTPTYGDVSAKFSVRTSKHDGQYKSFYNGETLGSGEAQAFRAAFTWAASESMWVDYVYDKSDRESNDSTTNLSHVRPVYASPFSPAFGGQYYVDLAAIASPERQGTLFMTSSSRDDSASDIDGHAVTFNWDWLENSTVKSITSYREWHSVARNTEFGSVPVTFGTVFDLSGRFGPTFSPIPGGTVLPAFGAMRDSAQRQWSQEFQVVGALLEERLRYNVGLYYFEEQANETNPQAFVLPTCVAAAAACANPALVGTAVYIGRPFFAYKTDNASAAIYGQFTYNVIPDLDVTFGYRYTYDEKETTLTNTFGSATTPSTVVDKDYWRNFNPSFIVDYRFSEELSSYFKVSTGYRSGGYNVRAASPADFRKPFDEEDIVSYEIGLKSDLLNRKLRLNASVYHTEYEDRQVAQFTAGSGGASTNIVNAGENTVDGFEIEALYMPFIGARVIATYGYIDVDNEEFITGRVDPVTGFPNPSANANAAGNEDIAGNGALDNVYAPQHSGSLALEYTFAPQDWGQLTLRVDATYTDEISFHPQFNLFDESDDHHLVNARATLTEIPLFKEGNVTIAAWGKNLENKEYRDFGIDFGGLGFAVNNYGELRSWGLDFIYEYNR